MKLTEQIGIVSELLEGVEELNGEHQEGWDEQLESGKRLLIALKQNKEESEREIIEEFLRHSKTVNFGEYNHEEQTDLMELFLKREEDWDKLDNK